MGKIKDNKGFTIVEGLIVIVLILVGGLGYLGFKQVNKKSKTSTSSTTAATTKTATPTTTKTATPTTTTTPPQNSFTEAATKPLPRTLTLDQAAELTAVVNKKHALPQDYIPELASVRSGQLRPEASLALEELFSDAEKTSLHPKIVSSYRSYSKQITTYNYYVTQYGQEKADTISARPGHSEHQTGLAVDVGNADGSCELDICFGATDLGRWLATHAQLYGFIIRYPEGKEAETGYQYEPWHIRYIGRDTAKSIYDSKKTLDQYYGVDAGGY